MKSDIRLSDLTQITEAIQQEWGEKAHQFIDYCGLMLESPPKSEFNGCTPKNVLTFASTGGDSVHYSILDIDKENASTGPIIMTVPMAFEEDINTVIAENLREFLGLGYYVGWFSLEQIVYQTSTDYSYFSKPDPDHELEEQRFLELVKDLFQIEYFELTKERLAALKAKHFDSLKVDLNGWA